MSDICTHGHPHGTGYPCTACLEEEIRCLNLQLSDMERRLSQQVNTRCTCGGAGPGEGCDWCNLYHYVKGTGFPEKRVENTSVPCVWSKCILYKDHHGEHADGHGNNW